MGRSSWLRRGIRAAEPVAAETIAPATRAERAAADAVVGDVSHVTPHAHATQEVSHARGLVQPHNTNVIPAANKHNWNVSRVVGTGVMAGGAVYTVDKMDRFWRDAAHEAENALMALPHALDPLTHLPAFPHPTMPDFGGVADATKPAITLLLVGLGAFAAYEIYNRS